jgi:hypothetical protein
MSTPLDKIKQDIVDRSMLKNFQPMTSSGKSEQEFDHRFCTSTMDELSGYYFVVSKVFKYKGNSMDDFGYVVYVYDEEGNYIDNPELQAYCKQYIKTFKDIQS